ncbi:nitrogen regulatory protein area [Diplodia corticola]|uniref:Nitrogen regulatory protein area n=1 Tax=Diplodia corticola TaxID=236234 RepID=A0A1J9QS32_9PEZI|nr:nitrogen regulatory protein area [Diplodia corticola]OJD31766.1 nitrogen regulatory protein area [Diplodia corticola]
MATTTHSRQASYLCGNDAFHTPSLTPASTLASSHDPSSPSHHHTCDDVLEDTVFPELKKNEESDVDELQKEDPMGIDMWKFYRNQSNVPDAERMENMTWRMMAINLRKAQQKKESSHPAVGHVKTPAAEYWSPTTASHQSTTAQPPKTRTTTTSTTPGIPDPPGASWTTAPGGRMGTIKSEQDLSDYQFSFTSHHHNHHHHHHHHHLSQDPQQDQPARFFPPPYGYGALDGPRGRIQLPNGPLKHEPDAPMPMMHARHVSLGAAAAAAGCPDGGDSFGGVKADDFTPHAQHASGGGGGGGGNVAPWDPGWAEDAFGGQSLYDRPELVKREGSEHGPLFDADGYLLPADDGWMAQDSSVLGGHGATAAQSLPQWQQFGENRYAEFSGQRHRFGTQLSQFGHIFTPSASGLGTQLSSNHQATCSSQASSPGTVGRKRRKER